MNYLRIANRMCFVVGLFAGILGAYNLAAALTADSVVTGYVHALCAGVDFAFAGWMAACYREGEKLLRRHDDQT